ncbi:uncharacterized protein LOC144819610 [Lissotriton helveticus]
MGLIICKIKSKFVSPWILCHHALKSTITKVSAVKKMPSLRPYYLQFWSVYLSTQEWADLIIITHCFMKIQTVIQRIFLATPEEQFGLPAPLHLSGIVAGSPQGRCTSPSNRSPKGWCRSPSNGGLVYCVGNSGVGLEEKNLLTAGWQSQNLAGIPGIKQLTITSCLFKKYLAARKRAKQKGTYEIKPTDSQGDQVDAVAAAAFLKFEENKTAVALLFRSENAWVQLCYQKNELLIESLETPSDYKKDHLFILCPLEQNRFKLQCAFHQESYMIVKKKGAGLCVSLGDSEDESIFELRTEDGELLENV